MKNKFWVIRDTREKVGFWDFPAEDKCLGTKSEVLKTGDYCVEGYEDILCIERKKTVSELLGNSTQKRFKDVIKRMESFKYKFIILEFDISTINRFPLDSGIPKSLWPKVSWVKPSYLLRYISELLIQHDIHVIFAGTKNNAEKIAYSIFKRVIEHEKR
jgi:hypothetical protein